MEHLHTLLTRQLRKCFGDIHSISPELRKFVDSVNEAYFEFDADRNMLERSLDLSSRELMQANSEMRAVIQAFPDIIFRIDQEGTILDHKVSSTKHLLNPEKNLVGKRIQSVPLKYAAARFGDAVRRIKESGKPVSIEYSLLADGNECHYEARFLPLPVNEFLVIIRDMTERKQAEEAFRKNRRLLDKILESLPVGVWIANKEGSLIAVNPAGRQIWAGSRYRSIADYWRRNSESMTEDEPADERESALALAVEKGETTLNEELEIDCVDGGTKTILNSAVPIRDSNHEIIGAIVVNEDITERKNAERMLRESERKFRAITNTATDAIILMDEEGTISYWNSAAEKIFGYRSEECVGRDLHLLLAPRQYHDSYRKGFEAFTAGGKGFVIGKPLELMALKKDGTEFPIEVSTSALEIGGKWHAAGIIRDITDRKKAAELLEESRERYKSLFEYNPDAVYLFDTEGNFIAANAECQNVSGYSVEELLTMSFLPCIIPECIENALEHFLKAVAGESQNYDTTIKHKNGRYIDINVTNVPVIVDGAIVGVFGIAKDITEHKRSSEELRETKDYLENLINYANAPIIVWDPAFTITRFNNAFEHLTGYTAGEVMGRELHILFPDGTRDESFREITRTLDGEYWKSVEIPIRRKDGSVRIALWNSANIYDKDNSSLLATIAQGQDITDRKLAEEALRESEEKYRTLVDNLSVGVYRNSGADGRFIQANPAMIKIFGYDSMEEFMSVGATELYENPEERNLFLQEAVRNGFVKDRELKMKKKDGTSIWASVTASVQYDKGGGIRWINGLLEDITEKKKFEEQLRQAQKMEAIGTLAGGVAHDFNNILTAIIGYANLVKEMNSDTEMLSYCEQILLSAERAADLTQQLLAFSRRQIIRPAPIDLNAILKKMQILLLRVVGEDIELRVSLSPEPLTVIADAGQMEQVIVNLTTNARDSMPGGGSLSVVTELTELDTEFVRAYGYGAPGKYAAMSIRDTGQGIDEQIRQRIFEPFFTTKEVGKGTGLGLAMVYGIVKQHQGYITVSSEVGRGTEFRIYLPLDKSGAWRDTAVASPVFKKGGTETILIAEDDDIVRKITRNILERSGYTVLEARDGEDAIARFLLYRDRIDLLLLDVIMPKKNGKEVYEEIRKIKPDMKTVFVSGYTADTIHRKGIDEKNTHFIQKPVRSDRLLYFIRNILDS